MTTEGSARPERLSRLTKILYGAGDTGFSLTSTTIGAFFAIFLTDVVGIRPGLAAVAIFIGRTWDYVNDPLIGHLSDRTRSRWGRRRPFLLFGFVPFALAFILLWWRPPLADPTSLAIYYALAYVVYDAAATFVYMPYFALTPELTLDYDERTALTSYRMFFSILAGLVAYTVPLMIIGSFRPGNEGRVLTMAAAFAAASALPLLLTFLGTKERPEFQIADEPTLRESLRAALANRPFLFSLGIFLLTWTAVDILTAMLLFFLKYWLGLEAQSDLIMGTVFIVGMFSLPLWEWVSRRTNKRTAYIAGIAFWAVVQIVLVIIQPGTGMVVVLVLAGLAGVGVGAAHVIPWSIIPDAVEWDEVATGQRHEGIFYSMITLAHKIASSIAIPLALLVLEYTGYVPNADVQSTRAVAGIRLMVGPAPAVLLCGGIAFAALYPLGRERHEQLRVELKRRRSPS